MTKRGRPKKNMSIVETNIRITKEVKTDLTDFASLVGLPLSDALEVLLKPHQERIEALRKTRYELGVPGKRGDDNLN
jgi:hypothetical protein